MSRGAAFAPSATLTSTIGVRSAVIEAIGTAFPIPIETAKMNTTTTGAIERNLPAVRDSLGREPAASVAIEQLLIRAKFRANRSELRIRWLRWICRGRQCPKAHQAGHQEEARLGRGQVVSGNAE